MISGDAVQAKIIKATGSPATSETGSPPTSETPASQGKRLLKAPSELVKDGIASLPSDNDFVYVEVEKQSSVQPTMWLGTQSGR